MKTNSNIKPMIIFFFMVLVSCSPMSPTRVTTPEPFVEPSPSQMPIRDEAITRWLSETGCSLPCWEDIRPGGTSFDQAVSRLEKISNAQITYKQDGVIEWKIPGVYGSKALTDGENGAIVLINVNINREQRMLLQEVVGVFGPPSFVHVALCSDGPCVTNLIYPDKGMAVGLFLPLETGGVNVQITENSQITGILFFVPGLENYSMIPEYGITPTTKWEGYGLYK